MYPAILTGTQPPVISDDGYVTMGGPDEATDYVTECGPAWHRTPGDVFPAVSPPRGTQVLLA
jgi:hypothetical protein